MYRRGTSTSQVAIVIAVIVIASLAVAYVIKPGPEESELKKVTLQLDWFPYPGHMHLFVAKDMFWPELGLDVNMVRGVGSGDTAMKVGLGVAEFGRASTDSGINVRTSEGLFIKSIFIIETKANSAIFWLKRDHGRGIIDIDDLTTLEGKIFANPEWGPVYQHMQVLSGLIGIDWDKIIFQHLDPGALLPALVAGEVDFIGSAIAETVGYRDTVAEALPGVEVGTLFFSEYGFVMPADSQWVSETLIHRDPEMVAAFIEGAQKGFKWAVEHMDEAVDIFIKYNPEWLGDEEGILEQIVASWGYGVDVPLVEEYGVGYQDPLAMEEAVANTYVFYGIPPWEALPTWQEVFTNEFIDPDIVPDSYPW